MAAEYKSIEQRRREAEKRTVPSTICAENFSCSKLMKFVSSLLHRSSYSYDVLASTSCNDLGNGSFKKKSDLQIAKVSDRSISGEFADQSRRFSSNSDQAKSGKFSDYNQKCDIIAFSISEDVVIPRQRVGRFGQRRSLATESAIFNSTDNDGVLLKSVIYASADNLPFTVSNDSPIEVDEKSANKKLKDISSLVRVHSLRIANEDGGILDPDDCLLAVVEDKEQIVAIYDEQEQSTIVTSKSENGIYPQRNGRVINGQSVDYSSIGRKSTQAPNGSVFVGGEGQIRVINAEQTAIEPNSVLVGEIPAVSNLLVVRRGSDPVLNRVDEVSAKPTGVVKRRVEFLNADVKERKHEDDAATPTDHTAPIGRFARTAARKSRLTDEWLEVAAQAAEDYRAKKLDDDANQTEELDQPRSVEVASNTRERPAVPPIGPMIALQKGNTRRIGQRLEIQLIKKPPPDGFGFTLTTRDIDFSTNSENAADALVYVKTICPNGAAIEDGRLKAGDRLLEISGRKLNREFGQPDVVRLLRQMQPGDVARLVVSRQTTVQLDEHSDVEKRAAPTLPRPLSEQNSNDESVADERNGNRSYDQTLLTFDIRLNDLGSAGLGVSVKGWMAPGQGPRRKDGGIFVKSILHGGAVHKDGRLRNHDRVMAVNGVDLSRLSNADAMQRLRSVMMEMKPTAKSIRLTVLRLVPVKEKDHNGGSADTSDGGRHRLLVNENSTTNGSNTIHYGDDDYAVIVKPALKKSTTGNFVGPWPHSEDDEPPVMIDWSETAGTSQRHIPASRSDSNGSSWAGDRLSRRDIEEEGSLEALFVRDAPTRRSMSEKRHGAARVDPSITATYQRIQHQRQTSAPSLQRKAVGGGSLINASPSKQASAKRKAEAGDPTPLETERRSMSLESLTKGTAAAGGEKKDKPLLHEEVAQSLQKPPKAPAAVSGVSVKWLKTKSAANRQRPTNESFRQAVDKSYLVGTTEMAVDVVEDSSAARVGQSDQISAQEPFYSQIRHSATTDSISATNRSRPVNKEKDRRKSTGGGLSLKNLFRFGSGGKANRPFAVVSPVNNGMKSDDGEDDFGTKDNERRQRSHDGERKHRTNGDHHGLDHGRIDQDLEKAKQLEAQAMARKQHEEEQRRIRQHYERMKEQQWREQNSAVAIAQRPGSHSPKPPYPTHQKMPSQWKPPVPVSSSPQTKIRLHPVMGREMAMVQHGRQHSGGGSSGSGASRLHSPGTSGQYQTRQPTVFSYCQYSPQQAPVPVPPRDYPYLDYQVASTRRPDTNKNGNISPKVGSLAQSSWFVDGVGGKLSIRHNRFYYSSTDGRPSDRVTSTRTTGDPQSTAPHAKESQSASQLPNIARARCTNEHVGKWPAANRSASPAAKGPIASTVDGTSNQHHQRNGHWNEQSSRPPQPAPHRVCVPDTNGSQDGHHRIIIGSIPIFDSRKDDGVTRIIIDQQANGCQTNSLRPPPDYEQYLRTRQAQNAVTAKTHNPRPYSEFFDESTAAKYEASSLPRKSAKKVDGVTASPPLRNLRYPYYH